MSLLGDWPSVCTGTIVARAMWICSYVAATGNGFAARQNLRHTYGALFDVRITARRKCGLIFGSVASIRGKVMSTFVQFPEK